MLQIVSNSSEPLLLGLDDVNRDVSPVKKAVQNAQGGHAYVYNLLSELDVAGEYFINRTSLNLFFLPPTAASGTYHISRLPSAVVMRGVTNVTFEGLEIRYARGAGVVIEASTLVRLDNCTISDHGMMGVNITNGSLCSVANSEVAGFTHTRARTALLTHITAFP